MSHALSCSLIRDFEANWPLAALHRLRITVKIQCSLLREPLTFAAFLPFTILPLWYLPSLLTFSTYDFIKFIKYFVFFHLIPSCFLAFLHNQPSTPATVFSFCFLLCFWFLSSYVDLSPCVQCCPPCWFSCCCLVFPSVWSPADRRVWAGCRTGWRTSSTPQCRLWGAPYRPDGSALAAKTEVMWINQKTNKQTHSTCLCLSLSRVSMTIKGHIWWFSCFLWSCVLLVID